MNSLIENCCFNIGNAAVKQAIGIIVEIDPTPFWANFCIDSNEEVYICHH